MSKSVALNIGSRESVCLHSPVFSEAVTPLIGCSTSDADELLKASEATTAMVWDMLQTVNAMLAASLAKNNP